MRKFLGIIALAVVYALVGAAIGVAGSQWTAKPKSDQPVLLVMKAGTHGELYAQPLVSPLLTIEWDKGGAGLTAGQVLTCDVGGDRLRCQHGEDVGHVVGIGLQ